MGFFFLPKNKLFLKYLYEINIRKKIYICAFLNRLADWTPPIMDNFFWISSVGKSGKLPNVTFFKHQTACTVVVVIVLVGYYSSSVRLFYEFEVKSVRNVFKAGCKFAAK